MIFCKDCKWLSNRWPYPYVKRIFVDPNYDPASNLKPEYVESPACQHSQCLETSTEITPIDKLVTKVRIKGQAQLNRHNNCIFFEEKPKTELEKVLDSIDAVLAEKQKPTPWYKFWL